MAQQWPYPIIFSLGICGILGCQSSPHNSTASQTVKQTREQLNSEVHEIAITQDTMKPVSPTKLSTQPGISQVTFQSDSLPVQPVIESTIPQPHELPSTLSLSDLEQMARTSNPSLLAASANIRALRGKSLQAGLPPNPTIGYAGSEIGNDGRAGQQGAYVSQEFITGNKLNLNRAIVNQEIVKAEQKWAEIEQRVLTDIRVAYYRMLIAQRKLTLASDLLEISNQAVDASKLLVQAKELALSGLLQSEVEAQNTLILKQTAINERDGVWRQLASVIGQPNLAPQSLQGDLETAASSLDWDEEVQRLSVQSPELAASFAELERTKWTLQRAYAQVIPDVTVQLGVQYDYSTEDAISGVQVGLPIPLWNKNQGAIQQARSEITAAQRNIERVELGLQNRLAVTFQKYKTAAFRVNTFKQEILPKAKQTFDLVQKGFKNGEAGYLDMLTVQRTYTQANLNYLDSLQQLWEAKAEIEGFLLNNSLSVEPSNQID